MYALHFISTSPKCALSQCGGLSSARTSLTIFMAGDTTVGAYKQLNRLKNNQINGALFFLSFFLHMKIWLYWMKKLEYNASIGYNTDIFKFIFFYYFLILLLIEVNTESTIYRSILSTDRLSTLFVLLLLYSHDVLAVYHIRF